MSVRLVQDTSTVAGRIRIERERLNIASGTLAAIAKVTNQQQEQWEAGIAVPDAHALEQFAVAGADVLFIVTGRRELLHPGTLDALSKYIAAETTSALQLAERRNRFLKELHGVWPL